MKVPEIPKNEKERIQALNEYSILDTLPEKDYDDLTRMASEICQTPISLISLIDPHRQWFKSHHGLDVTETPRDVAFCAHAINNSDDIFIVNDSRLDIRFSDNPLVTGQPHVIFYAGVPLKNPEGYALGTLCIIDHQPKKLNENQIASLKSLANHIVNLFELRKKNMLLQKAMMELGARNLELEQFSYIVSHDIKSPLNNILGLTKIIKKNYGERLDGEGNQMLDYIDTSVFQLKNLVEGIIEYYSTDRILASYKDEISLYSELKTIASLLDTTKEFEFTFPDQSVKIKSNKSALNQIFMNLINNAIKYNHSLPGKIDISFAENDTSYIFTVKDNGMGIKESDQAKLFNIFVTLGKKDRFNNVGTGIGLTIVKKLVNKLGGKISLKSALNEGTEVTFTIQK